jgi:hypothetical protein
VNVTVVADERQLHALAPLVARWDRVRVMDDARDLGALADGADAVLVVGPRRRAPRTVLPGPVLYASDGRPVSVGWLPDAGPAALNRFARCAAAVHARSASVATLAVLGQRQPRFDRLAGRVARIAGEERVPVQRWTAYDVPRDALARNLAGGPALGVYVGHGRPIGWVGYAGLRAQHLGPAVDPRWQPLAALFSLACSTASRRRTGTSFAEATVLGGGAAAALGAVGSTRPAANARLAVRIVRSLPHASTVGELVAAVATDDPAAPGFRLVGDPTAPLRDAPQLSTRRSA